MTTFQNTTTKEVEKGNVKPNVPTTVGAVSVSYKMEVGDKKRITVDKIVYISVPSGHTVTRQEGVTKGNLGDTQNDGRWTISLQSKSGKSITFTATVN